jgi:hypothetical protein
MPVPEFSTSIGDFITWLGGHKPDDVVGVACHGNTCPIASWIASQLPPGTTVITMGNSIRIAGDNRMERYPAPLWIDEFIRQLDNSVDDPIYDRVLGEAITAARALEIANRLD